MTPSGGRLEPPEGNNKMTQSDSDWLAENVQSYRSVPKLITAKQARRLIEDHGGDLHDYLTDRLEDAANPSPYFRAVDVFQWLGY